jgi:hypothetical protein
MRFLVLPPHAPHSGNDSPAAISKLCSLTLDFSFSLLIQVNALSSKKPSLLAVANEVIR